MPIPPALVEEIKYHNDIVDVISSYVTLRRAGSNLNGLCPFHSEKTPSFTVFPASKSFYCFGCGAGGDVITFVMKTENLDYPQALERLASRVGIEIPRGEREAAGSVRRTRLYEMNKAAAHFFHDNLLAGGPGLVYLTEKRKLPMAVIRHFGLGYAPNDFGALQKHLRGCGFTDAEMTAGWLCGTSQKTGRLFDMFRNRVMFPIIDVSGNVIAFGGRVMDDSKPKYLNSSDTPAFKKSRNLFALNYAKNHCAESMILCEGYMDVIALHAAGFENAVATLGTALTPEQARLMKRYTKRVYLSYDSDAAGQNASDKAFRLLEEAGLDVRILKMTGAKDPDEYIKAEGAGKFRQIIEKSRSQFDYRLDGILERYDVALTDDRIKAAAEAAQYLSGVHSAVEREVYIGRAAETLGISAESLKGDVDRMIRKRIREQKREQTNQLIHSTERIGDRINPDALKNVRAANAEEAVLGILLLYPELIPRAREKLGLAPEVFVTAFNRRVLESLLRHADGAAEDGVPFDVGMLGADFTPDEIGRIMRMQITRQSLTQNDEAVLVGCIATLRDAAPSEDGGVDAISRLIESKKKKNGSNQT